MTSFIIVNPVAIQRLHDLAAGDWVISSILDIAYCRSCGDVVTGFPQIRLLLKPGIVRCWCDFRQAFSG